MTVNYNLCVATSHPWTLLRILLRWRGSLWKAVGIQAAIWSILYCLIHIAHRELLTIDQQRRFQNVARVLDQHIKDIPLDFMLGFFVTVIVTRWSTLFNNIGLIENLAHTISACVRGSDDKTRTRRRNIIRYSVVAQLLAFRDISVQVRKRFPTMDTVVASGFLMSHELKELEGLNSAAANMGKHGCLYGKTWIPIEWAITLLKKARYEEETISSDILLSKCLEEIRRFRTNLLTLTNYDWVPLPIMYPQLVTLAVHLFFFIALFSRQFSPSGDPITIDFVIPVMSCLQFTFYMGWLKVAEALLNPFGEDDDDFECNFLLDRNLIIGISIVDDGNDQVPEERKDEFWRLPIDLLYSEKSMQRRAEPLAGSATGILLPTGVSEITMMSLSGRDCDCATPRKISVIRTPSSLTPSPGINRVVSRLRKNLSGTQIVANEKKSPQRQLSMRDDSLPSWIEKRLSIVPEMPNDTTDSSLPAVRTRSISETDHSLRPPQLPQHYETIQNSPI